MHTRALAAWLCVLVVGTSCKAVEPRDDDEPTEGSSDESAEDSAGDPSSDDSGGETSAGSTGDTAGGSADDSTHDSASDPTDGSADESDDSVDGSGDEAEESSDDSASDESEASAGDSSGGSDESDDSAEPSTGEGPTDDSNSSESDSGDSCSQVSAVPNEGAEHYPVGTELEYEHNPPTSGPHYPIWAKYGAYDEVVPRNYWIHNLEHGAVVLLHGPSATDEQRAQLRAVYDALPDDEFCGLKRAILTPDPELDDAIAVVAWDWALEASCVEQDVILSFVGEHRGEGPEGVCQDGSFEP